MSQIKMPQIISDCANAYRTVSGTTDPIKNGELASKIALLSSGGLPAGYTKKSYLQSHGTEYINTGYYPNEKTCVEIVFQVVEDSSTAYASPFGTKDELRFYNQYDNSSGRFYYKLLPYAMNSFTMSDYHNKTYFKSLNGVAIISNGTKTGATSGTPAITSFTSPVSMLLFNCRSKNSPYNPDIAFFKGKIFMHNIIENNELKRVFIPCVRNSDNVAGLYDMVTATFCTNQGTGNFETD